MYLNLHWSSREMTFGGTGFREQHSVVKTPSWHPRHCSTTSTHEKLAPEVGVSTERRSKRNLLKLPWEHLLEILNILIWTFNGLKIFSKIHAACWEKNAFHSKEASLNSLFTSTRNKKPLWPVCPALSPQVPYGLSPPAERTNTKLWQREPG